MRLTPELEELAKVYGVQTSYLDVRGEQQQASQDTLLAVLRCLGAEIDSPDDAAALLHQRRREIALQGVEPVIVSWEGRATQFALTVPAAVADDPLAWTITSEDGSLLRGASTSSRKIGPAPQRIEGYVALTLSTPDGLARGYYDLALQMPDNTYHARLICAPAMCRPPSAGGSTAGNASIAKGSWGCFLPLYALRSQRNWGAGDFTDLKNATAWLSQLGGSFMGTLPLLAAFLDEPFEPSPYAPLSRLFWNEFYLDVEAIPQYRQSAGARELVTANHFQAALRDLQQSDQVDYRSLMARKRQVLELLAREFLEQKASDYGAFQQFLQERPALREYGAFRAVCERRRQPWQQWPASLRDGRVASADYDPAVAHYHCYVQWQVHQQLEHLSRQASRCGDGLYLDFPLGVRRDGYDVWRHRDCYGVEASAGAPPDPMFSKGQDWGFAPLHPHGIRQDGYRHVRNLLANHLRMASTLRIDHVMGLHRLYWIPPGLPASEGLYVSYRPDEFYAVLSLESHRHQSSVVGENLGTVPPEVDEAMTRHGVRRMYIVQYETEGVRQASGDSQDPAGTSITPALKPVPSDCIASLNTHDMPPFAAWWLCDDIADRHQLGLMNDQQAEQERQERADLKKRMTAWLKQERYLDEVDGQSAETDRAAARLTLRGLLNYLAASSAELMLVNLEDLWLETRPQNVPGTSSERPNWQRKTGLPWEQLVNEPMVVDVLRQIDQLRTAPQYQEIS